MNLITMKFWNWAKIALDNLMDNPNRVNSKKDRAVRALSIVIYRYRSCIGFYLWQLYITKILGLGCFY